MRVCVFDSFIPCWLSLPSVNTIRHITYFVTWPIYLQFCFNAIIKAISVAYSFISDIIYIWHWCSFAALSANCPFIRWKSCSGSAFLPLLLGIVAAPPPPSRSCHRYISSTAHRHPLIGCVVHHWAVIIFTFVCIIFHTRVQ